MARQSLNHWTSRKGPSKRINWHNLTEKQLGSSWKWKTYIHFHLGPILSEIYPPEIHTYRGWLHYCFQWGAKGSKMGKKIPNLTYTPICRGLVRRKQFNHWLSSSTNQRFSVILTPSLLQGVSKRHEPVLTRDTWEAERTGDTKRLRAFMGLEQETS